MDSIPIKLFPCMILSGDNLVKEFPTTVMSPSPTHDTIFSHYMRSLDVPALIQSQVNFPSLLISPFSSPSTFGHQIQTRSKNNI